jgi:xanthine dehydrogenase YagR molybdenum-binding subunit
VFTLTGHRPEMMHRVRLAAQRDGRLTALGHDEPAGRRGGALDRASGDGRSIAACGAEPPDPAFDHQSGHQDRRSGPRPGELPGLLAFETAMDELAYALDLDPVELRLINDTDIDPELGVPRTAGA